MSIREILVKHGALQFSVNPVAMEELKAEILKCLPKKRAIRIRNPQMARTDTGFNQAVEETAQYMTELFEETK